MNMEELTANRAKKISPENTSIMEDESFFIEIKNNLKIAFAEYEKINKEEEIDKIVNEFFDKCLKNLDSKNLEKLENSTFLKIFPELITVNGLVNSRLLNFLFKLTDIAKKEHLISVLNFIYKYFNGIKIQLGDNKLLPNIIFDYYKDILLGSEKLDYGEVHNFFTKLNTKEYLIINDNNKLFKSEAKNHKSLSHIILNFKELIDITISNEEDNNKIKDIENQIEEIKNGIPDIYKNQKNNNIKSAIETIVYLRNEKEISDYIEYLHISKLEIILKNHPDLENRLTRASQIYYICSTELFPDEFTEKDFLKNLPNSKYNNTELFHSYKNFMTGPFMSHILFDKLGYKIEDYSFQEQVFFIYYLKDISINYFNKIKRFINDYNKKGTKTFFSVAYKGLEVGDKILTLGEKLPKEIANKIFNKYGEIIDTADNTEEEIKKIFGDKDISARVLVSVKETLLKRGAQMLSDLGDKVLDPNFKLNEVDILKELNNIKEETIILGKSYLELYREGIRVPIDEITTIKEISTENLNKKQKEELIKIYEKGRPKVTYESKEHLDFLKKEFKEELNDKNFFVNEICFKNETIIIALVNKRDKENLYVGGLTFIEEVQNAAVAEATMRHVLEKFKDKNIRALVDIRNPLLIMYQKRFGFKIMKKLDSPEEIKKNGGQIYVEIEKIKEQPDKNLI